MIKTKQIFPLILLPLLLTGCGERTSADSSVADTSAPASSAVSDKVEDSSVVDSGNNNDGSSSSSSTNNKNRTVLRQSQINDFAGEDYTASVSLTNEGETVFDYIAKHGDGLAEYQYYDSDNNLAEFGKVFKGSNGNAFMVGTPDKHNEIGDNDFDEKWFLDNTFGDLDAFSFSYITPDDGEDDGYYYFGIADDCVDDEETLASIEAVLEQEVKFISANIGLTFDENFIDFMIYTDGSKICGYKGSFDASYYYASYGISIPMTIDFDVMLSRVGTTGLNAADFTCDPYTIPAGQESQYAAFTSAITSMKAATSYKYDSTLSSSGSVVASEETYVNSNGIFSKYTESDTTEYYGLKLREDGLFDYYTGESPDALTAKNTKEGPLSDYLPDFDTAVEIFDFNAAKSTATSYQFDLKADFTDDALTEICYDYAYTGYESYATSLSVIVTSDGALDKVIMSLEDGYGNTYEAIADYDTFTGEVPATIADFTSYTEFVMPTSFAELSLDYGSTTTILTVQDAIDDAFGNGSSVSVPFFLGSSLYGGCEINYYPEDDQGGAEIDFVFDASEFDVDSVAAVMNSCGYSLVYDSTYGEWDQTFTSGSASFEVAVWDYYSNYTVVTFYVA